MVILISGEGVEKIGCACVCVCLNLLASELGEVSGRLFQPGRSWKWERVCRCDLVVRWWSQRKKNSEGQRSQWVRILEVVVVLLVLDPDVAPYYLFDFQL